MFRRLDGDEDVNGSELRMGLTVNVSRSPTSSRRSNGEISRKWTAVITLMK